MRSSSGPTVTLEHVALAAGVSRATASRALTGSGPVSDEARRRVLVVAGRLGYVPDPVARALVRGAGTRVVLAVCGRTSEVLRDPYVDRLAAELARVCHPHGLGASVQWLPLAGGGAALLELGRDRTVGAVVLANATAELSRAVPAALRGRTVAIGAPGPGVPAFDVDVEAGATAVVRHLVASGRRRIAMLAGPEWMQCLDGSEHAYDTVVRDAGLPRRTVTGDFTAASGRAGAREVLRRWPDTDAVFAVCDAAALGAVASLRDAGRQVPGDVAVAGFDDIPAAELAWPALTTATHPVEQIAAAAAEAALDGVRGEDVVLFGSQLVARAST